MCREAPLSDELRSILIGTAPLDVCAVVALILTFARGPVAASDAQLRSAVGAARLALVLQGIHFVEELLTGFPQRFPELLGLDPWPVRFFVPFNLAWIAVWALSSRGLARRRRVALFPLWFLGIGGLLNGLAHPAFAMLAGGYFPGLVTSPLVGVAGLLLLRHLARVTRGRLPEPSRRADRAPGGVVRSLPVSDAVENYEQVSVYHLDDEDREALLSHHAECTFNWVTKDGWPMGVIMSYLWHDGRLWLTAGAHRHRITAVRRDPRVSVVITSTGTRLGTGKSITVKGRCTIHEDDETKAWFYPAFSQHLHKDEKMAKWFQTFLDSPLRVVLEVVPEKWITYDGTKMAQDSVGKLDPSRRGEPKSADAVRMKKELERRGLG